MVEHADPLLKHNRGARVTLYKRLVAHVESTHELKHGNFDREVEGSDHTDSTEGPSVGSVELSCMVTWLSLRLSQEAHSITTVVLEEVNGDCQFSSGLDGGLGGATLNTLDKEIEHFRVVHAFDNPTVDLAEHQVSLLVLEGVVQAGLGH